MKTTLFWFAFLCKLLPTESSIPLGACDLSCNEAGGTQLMNQEIRPVPHKSGPKGDVGPPGAVGRPGAPCVCSKYEDALNNIVENRFQDCADVKRVVSTNGVSVIFPFPSGAGIHVYCDQLTDGGGWIVIQRRTGGTEEFFRGWDDYVTGFGSKENEFWMGLEIIHRLTTNGSWELRVDLVDEDGDQAYAGYRSFRIADADDNYRLSVSGFKGTAGDSLRYHNGMQFTTKDRDNDASLDGNCATVHDGAWWYNRCHRANLNGRLGASEASADGVTWYQWRGRHVSLKRAEMKIKKVR